MSWTAPEDRKPSLPVPIQNRYSTDKMPAANQNKERREAPTSAWSGAEFWILRALLLAATAALCYGLQPFAWPKAPAALAGFAFAAVLFVVEWRTRRGAPGGVIGGALG